MFIWVHSIYIAWYFRLRESLITILLHREQTNNSQCSLPVKSEVVSVLAMMACKELIYA